MKEVRNPYLADKRIVAALHRLADRMHLERVMLYIPLPIEVDIRPFANALRRAGKRVYVPYMEGESFRLVQYRYPLRRKRFGVLEPQVSYAYRPKRIDMAIVPIVGTDASLRRVGFGKGMYDRFFEKEKRDIGYTVFVSRIACISDEIVTDDFDVAGDTFLFFYA